MEEIANCGVTEEVFKDFGSFIANDPAEFGVEGGHGPILSRAPPFWSIEAKGHE